MNMIGLGFIERIKRICTKELSSQCRCRDVVGESQTTNALLSFCDELKDYDNSFGRFARETQ